MKKNNKSQPKPWKLKIIRNHTDQLKIMKTQNTKQIHEILTKNPGALLRQNWDTPPQRIAGKLLDV